MVNMNVQYVRNDRALMTLRDEVYAVYGYTPERPSEFVTGYRSVTNKTGHNADINGIVHAVDIFTDEHGNLPEAEGRELAQLIVNEMIRRGLTAGYVIHDMSPGEPWPAIAGAFNGWRWETYYGSSPHSDHIHVSMCDMYWGDPAPVGPDQYDSTESWNLGEAKSTEEDDMYTDGDRARDEQFKQFVTDALVGKGGTSMIGGKALQFQLADLPANTWWKTTVHRDGEDIPVIQELADVKTLLIGQQAQIAGLTEALKQVATNAGSVDFDKIESTMLDTLKTGLTGAEVTISLAKVEQPKVAESTVTADSAG